MKTKVQYCSLDLNRHLHQFLLVDSFTALIQA